MKTAYATQSELDSTLSSFKSLNYNKYDSIVSPLLFVGTLEVETILAQSNSLIAVSSRDYKLLIENMKPKMFFMEYVDVSSDTSWKMNKNNINNIRQMKELIALTKSAGCLSIIWIRKQEFVNNVDIELINSFDKVALSNGVRLSDRGCTGERFTIGGNATDCNSTEVLELFSTLATLD